MHSIPNSFRHNLLEQLFTGSLLVRLDYILDLWVIVVHAKSAHVVLNCIERGDDTVIALDDLLDAKIVDCILNPFT